MLSVSDFTAGDINVTGAYPVALTPVTAGTLWRLQVTITDQTAGTIIITIPANVVSIGNDLEIQSFAYNRVTRGTAARPTLHTPRTGTDAASIISQPIKVNDFYVPITFDGNQAIQGFDENDISVTNACKGDLDPLTGSGWPTGRSFILHIDNHDDFDGTVTITIAANATTQSGSNVSGNRNYTVDTAGEPAVPPDQTEFTITECL